MGNLQKWYLSSDLALQYMKEVGFLWFRDFDFKSCCNHLLSNTMDALKAKYLAWTVTQGNELIQWARPAGWPASPAAVSKCFIWCC